MNKKNPLAKSIVENGRLKHYYRKDAVLKLLNRERVTKYRKTCVHCKKKFERVDKENACPECSKRFDIEPNKWYDLTALRALSLVVTSDRAWRIATKSIIIFWIIAIGMIILGGI